MTPQPRREPAMAEFIGLVALLISMVAMSIDSMLPAIGEMAAELGAQGANDRQLVISVFFFGLAFGQFFYGPVSDATGRRPTLFFGLFLFMAGTALAALAWSFPVLLAARLIQGLGAAGPRIIAVAMVRDRYEGRAMARIMSMAMSVFILVPIFAPSAGQAVILLSGWRMIFGALLVMALTASLWAAIRQRETLAPTNRRPLSPKAIWSACAEVVTTRVSAGYIMATSFLFGAFIGYLNSTQQMFGEAYGLGTWFPVFFGCLAFSLGIASILNARLVMRFGMHYLSVRAAAMLAGLSILFLPVTLLYGGLPPLPLLMAYLVVVFFCSGVLFGNYNALAMEPMGHIAGAASAIIGSLTTFLSLVLGTFVSQAYDGTADNVVTGFALYGAGALGAQMWAEARRRRG